MWNESSEKLPRSQLLYDLTIEMYIILRLFSLGVLESQSSREDCEAPWFGIHFFLIVMSDNLLVFGLWVLNTVYKHRHSCQCVSLLN